jgi:hypothetical protein
MDDLDYQCTEKIRTLLEVEVEVEVEAVVVEVEVEVVVEVDHQSRQSHLSRQNHPCHYHLV